jgi:hypothetical protein
MNAAEAAALLQQLAALLGTVELPFRAEVRTPSGILSVAVDLVPLSAASGASSPLLTPPERSILSAAATTPMTAPRLARKLGRPCNSHFRSLLRGLVRRGLLLHTPDGYRLP